VSDDELHVEEGSLYPALHRREAEGGVDADGGGSDNRRRATCYSLTPLGRRMLRAEEGRWERCVATVTRVLAAAPGSAA
jgi:DNA-binding PadR family transcriptional regulator